MTAHDSANGRRNRPSGVHVTVETRASAADIETVVRGLRAFNTTFIGEPRVEPVHIFLRDARGTVVGGLLGQTLFGWMYIAKLWIDEAHRGRGSGRALLEAAESLARERGCIGMFLDTFEYQARPFYEKHGFEVFGTLEGYPPGYRQYYLTKRLR